MACTTIGSLSGSISTTTKGSKAYGIYAENGDLNINGPMSGTIVASAGGDEAYGLYSFKNVTLGGVSGTISAEAKAYSAAGVFSGKNLLIDGDMSGSVLARSTGPAFGMISGGLLSLKNLSGSVKATGTTGGGLDGDYVSILGDISGSIIFVLGNSDGSGIYSTYATTIGSLSGSISTSTKNSKASGIYAERGDLNINGPLSGTIVASAGGDEAYGLYSIRNVTLGDVSGRISAEAKADMAFGVFCGKDLIIDGDVSGSVSAVAAGSHALGVLSDQTTQINGDMSGSVSASAGSSAYAFQTEGFTLNGDMSGSLVAAAAGRYACGIESLDTMTLNGVLSGSIDATAQTLSYGLRGIDTMTFNNGLTGSVTAVAREDLAYAIFTEQDIVLSGGLSGTVSASAGGANAYGLMSLFGKIDGNGVPLDISGIVSATAKGRAVAVSAPQGMNINVIGSLQATDTSGGGEAYAVRAGGYDWRTHAWIPGGAVNDTVVLGNGASVAGKIDLGGGTNLLTLDGAGSLRGDVSNITTMTKSGAGTWDTSGDISTNDLTVQAGTLKVTVTQTNTPTVQVANNFTNNGEVAFALGCLMGSGQSFTALTSANLSGTGTYSSSPLLDTNVVGNKVVLTKKSYMEVVDAGNPNAVVMASVLNPLTATASGDMAAILGTLDSSASQQAFNANLNELGGVFSSGMTAISLGTAHQISLATQARMAEMRAYQIMLAKEDHALDPEDPESWPMLASNGDMALFLVREPEFSPNSIHLRVLGRTGDMSSHGGYAGYDHKSIILSGGYDRVLGDGFLAGVSGGYAQTQADYKDAGGSGSTLDSYSLGLYGTWFDDKWYVDTVIAGAYNVYDMARRLAAFNRTANSDSSGYTMSAKSAGGYRFDVGGYGLTPTASLEYTRFHQAAYTESGAGAANLSVSSIDCNFLESGLGVKVDRTWQTDFGQIVPELSAMWMHEWLTQDRALTVSMTGMPGTVFPQTMAETARDALRFGAGVNALLDKSTSLSLRYQGDIEEHASSHSLMCEAQFLF